MLEEIDLQLIESVAQLNVNGRAVSLLDLRREMNSSSQTHHHGHRGARCEILQVDEADAIT